MNSDCPICVDLQQHQKVLDEFTKSLPTLSAQLAALPKLGSPPQPPTDGRTYELGIQMAEFQARKHSRERLEALLVPPTPPLVSSYSEKAILLHHNHFIDEILQRLDDLEAIIEKAGNGGQPKPLTVAEIAAALRARTSSGN